MTLLEKKEYTQYMYIMYYILTLWRLMTYINVVPHS